MAGLEGGFGPEGNVEGKRKIFEQKNAENAQARPTQKKTGNAAAASLGQGAAAPWAGLKSVRDGHAVKSMGIDQRFTPESKLNYVNSLITRQAQHPRSVSEEEIKTGRELLQELIDNEKDDGKKAELEELKGLFDRNTLAAGEEASSSKSASEGESDRPILSRYSEVNTGDTEGVAYSRRSISEYDEAGSTEGGQAINFDTDALASQTQPKAPSTGPAVPTRRERSNAISGTPPLLLPHESSAPPKLPTSRPPGPSGVTRAQVWDRAERPRLERKERETGLRDKVIAGRVRALVKQQADGTLASDKINSAWEKLEREVFGENFATKHKTGLAKLRTNVRKSSLPTDDGMAYGNLLFEVDRMGGTEHEKKLVDRYLEFLSVAWLDQLKKK